MQQVRERELLCGPWARLFGDATAPAWPTLRRQREQAMIRIALGRTTTRIKDFKKSENEKNAGEKKKKKKNGVIQGGNLRDHRRPIQTRAEKGKRHKGELVERIASSWSVSHLCLKRATKASARADTGKSNGRKE